MRSRPDALTTLEYRIVRRDGDERWDHEGQPPRSGTGTTRTAEGSVRLRRLAATRAVSAALGGCTQSLRRPLKEHRSLNQSRNLAARAGRWSAQHRKTAILGWILFVVLATVVGGRVGLNEIDESAAGSGESKRGDMIIAAAGFPDQAGELVLIQGKGRSRPTISR